MVTQRSLAEAGIPRQLAAKYVQHGWLDRLGAGAYTRSGDKVDWRGGLYALQNQLGKTVHAGGQTSLELQGLAHFLPLGRHRQVTLTSDRPEQLPAWFQKHRWEETIGHHCLSLFTELPEEASTQLDCGAFAITASSPERAMMEQLRLAQTNDDMDHAVQLMETLTTLRPKVVQVLLERCTSVKVKRLFLWSAEAAEHPWIPLVRRNKIGLGTGKRQLYRGGRLDPHYQITVPRRETPPGV